MQPLLPQLNGAAATWFSFVCHVTWQASLLAVLILAVVRLGRRWASPLRYWLLVLALAKFALPPLLSLPTGLFSRVGPAVEAVAVEANGPTIAAGIVDSPSPLQGMPLGPVPVGSGAEAVRPVAEPISALVVDLRVWLMLLHVLGILASAFWVLRGLLAMRRILRRANEVPDGELQRRFLCLSELLGLRRPPRLLLAHDACGPFAFGVLRPVVVLPEAAASLEAPALDAILAHELAHHRRGDLWVNWVQLALGAVWWFNPVLLVLNRQIRKVREDCCDDLLLTRNLTTGPAYCDTLLLAASRLNGRAAAGVSLGIGGPLHPLGRRFERIMDRTLRRAPRLSRAGILVLAVLASLVLPGLRRSDGDEPVPAAKQAEPAAPAAKARDEAAAEPEVWPEGATVEGRVLDHRGMPVANAEVLLLGNERIIVDADRRNWFVSEGQTTAPPSTRTDKHGAFAITRKQGTADRLAVIAEDPLFWVVFRSSLKQAGKVEIRLPASGSLAVNCDIPSKPRKQPVMIELRSFDGVVWNDDFLRFYFSMFSLNNPGETIFEHLPPGHYTVQRQQETRTGGNTTVATGADRRLVQIESAKRAVIHFERKIGRPLSGRVRGLENVELRYAYLEISHPGPEEVLGRDERRGRLIVAFDVMPISSEGRFTTDPIPPGKYSASLFAVRASTPRLSSQSSDFSGGGSFVVPEHGDTPRLEIVAKPTPRQDLSKVTDLRLRVVDEDGKPVSRLQAMIHTAEAGYGPWVEGRDGMVFLGGEFQYRGAEVLELLVRADGYAPAAARFAGNEREKLTRGEAAITLRRGQKVELRFHLPGDLAWPKGTLPEAYFDSMQERVRMMWQPENRREDVVSDFNMLNLRDAGPGRFELHLAEDTPRFHVAVQAPGFLQGFETGPFTLADMKNGSLDIDLPRPATLDASFEPGDHPGAELPFKAVALSLMRQLRGNSYLSVASTTGPSPTPRLKVADLAPGSYLVSVRTQPGQGSTQRPGGEINVGAYYDQRRLTLKAGLSERIDFRSTPYDPNAFRGTRTAVVRIRSADGTPAKGRKVSVTYFDGHYGLQPVFTGTVPESGEVVIVGITDAVPPSSEPDRAYTVSVDGQRLGSFGFAKGPSTQSFEFALAPAAGDMAPDVELTSLASGKAIRLSSLRGKVMFLEFWATWCGPCQQPMGKLNTLWAEHHDGWKDRVAIVPLSIDAARERVNPHVQARGWTALEHFWTGGSGGGDFQAPAARAFVVSLVPQAFLIGPDGRILWRGHPLDESDGKGLQARIDDALK